MNGVIVYVTREPTSVVVKPTAGRSTASIEKVGSTGSCEEIVARPVLSDVVVLYPSRTSRARARGGR